MQIELITNVAGSSRFAENWTDRAWLICENAGSGSTGVLAARAGDVTCLYMVGATTYTDRNSVTASVGYEAIECHATNAPPQLMLGAWHDTPAVSARGRIQCHGWDDDALVDVQTAATDIGLAGVAVTAEPHVIPTAAVDVNNVSSGLMCTVVERAGNMTNSTEGNHAVYWRT